MDSAPIPKIIRKLKEIYLHGLTKNQRIAAACALILFLFTSAIWIFNLVFNSVIDESQISSQNTPYINSEYAVLSESSSDKINAGYYYSNNSNTNNPVPTIPKLGANTPAENQATLLPEQPNHNSAYSVAAAPGPLDNYLQKIKEEHKDDPKYPLISGYMVYLKQIADGKRAWTDYHKAKAIEYFGSQKGAEIENQIIAVNGNKEEKIRNTQYKNLDDLFSAIKKDTDQYTEKTAINGFLDHVKEVSLDKSPWNEAIKGTGEVDLEKAWVEQIDAKIRSLKEKKAKKFNSRSYKNIGDLIAAIKNDTINYDQKTARDAFLNYIEELSKKNSLSQDAIDSGVYLLEDYQLEKLKGFIN